MNILVVDDEPELREFYRSFLLREGHTVTMLSSGYEALEFLTGERPDLILTDLLMPDGNGMRVIDEATRRSVPFVILSGYGQAYQGVLPKNARVLEKTVELDSLKHLLREALGAAAMP